MKKIFILLALAIPVTAVAQQPPGTEIYLFDLVVKKKSIELVNPKNITNRTGYDNQPHFHPEKPFVYFSSADESGRTDIMVYNYETGETKKFTNTPEREYSPTVTSDGKFISCIIQRDNGAQDLGKYPIEGGEPVIIVDNLTVGYHAWINDDALVLFVLGRPNTLRLYSISEKKDQELATNIGRSLHRIPGTNNISFIDKQGEKWHIKKYESATGMIVTITPTLPNREDLAWTADGKILMSDGSAVFYWSSKKKEWSPIALSSNFLLKGVTRLAVNNGMTKLAVVVEE